MVSAPAGPQPYRFLLTRRWVGLLVVALLVATGCVLMGLWQVDRLGERHARNDLLARTLVARPVPADRLLAVGRDPRARDEYSRVRARGWYLDSDRLLVRTRPFQGQVGYYVLVPLRTEGGPVLLVNRGWVDDAAGADGLPDVPASPAGPVEVTARIRLSEPPSTTGRPPAGQVTRIDVAAIAATLPYDVYGGYADLAAEAPRPDRAPALLPEPEPAEGPHLAYAFQWFLFAALALGGYVVLARREQADRDAAAADQAPARPAGAPGVPSARAG